jgi:Dolichyl-phosphate-mannose-protein mannosyltransferase
MERVEDLAMATARSRSRRRPVQTWLAAVPATPDVARALVAIAAASTLLRVILASVAHAPVIFSDELAYEKLAQSIGRSGHLALFNEHGLSYSPLYSLVLAPIYTLGVSAPAAYSLIKLVNAVLMSLSIFPTYKIARFVLPRRSSLVAAGLSALAPLMFYTSFSMSENLAYPVCLTAFWALLATIRAPGARNDALLLGAVVAASATRAQLVVLVPAALTAVLLTAALDREPPGGFLRRLGVAIDRHRLLFGALGAALLVTAGAALAGEGVFSVLGSYANVGRSDLPGIGRFLRMLAWHVAGVDLGVGIVPFAAAIITAVVFARRRFRGNALPFATVAVSVTGWLILEVAYGAAVLDVNDIPRIHERYLIYVVPFFLIALLATVHIPEREASGILYLAGCGLAALLLLAIPFHTVINQVSAVDTFGLQPLAHTHAGKIVALPHPSLIAVGGAAVLGFLFFHVRRQARATVILMLIPLLLIGSQELSRISAGSLFARSRLPPRADWVDATKPAGPVVLVTAAEEPSPALQTAYANYSISRLYYLCRPVAGREFGERRVTIDPSGRFRGPTGPVAAAYAVVPTGLQVEGRIVARNRRGRELLVALPRDRLGLPPARRAAALRCGR